MTDILYDVDRYYSAKLDQFGAAPLGVDWNSEESQVQRFVQLSKLITAAAPCTICDVGCGYGAYLDYLDVHLPGHCYSGCDISASMINQARHRHGDVSGIQFFQGREPKATVDYVVASGIFNVRMQYEDKEWLCYINDTLARFDRKSRLGFAFNCLTSYSDAEKMQRHLYYADPCLLFDHCKRSYSRQVALLHDYGLYEFTILVKKN